MTASSSEPIGSDSFTEQCATLYGCAEDLRRQSAGWNRQEGRTDRQKAANDVLIHADPLLDDEALKAQPAGASQLAAFAGVLAAHLAITDPAVIACSGSPPKELVDARARCRTEITKTWAVLQAHDSNAGSKVQPATSQHPDPAHGDSAAIVKDMAAACADAVNALTRTCDALVTRTADTCDALVSRTADSCDALVSRTADSCDALVSRTADTCDAILMMAAAPHPNAPTSGPAYPSDDAGNQTLSGPPASPGYASDTEQPDPAYPPTVITTVVEQSSGYATTFGRSEGTEATSDSERVIGSVLEQLFGDGMRQPSSAQAFAQPQQPSGTSPATALFLNNVNPAYQEVARQVLGPEPANLADLDLGQFESACNSAMAKSLSTVRDSRSPYRAVDVLELFRLGGKLRAERARYASRAGRR